MPEQAVDEALSSLTLAGLAGELAEPLAALKAGLDLLGPGADGESSELLGIARRQVGRLEGVLAQLALAARIECAQAARDEAQSSACDLGACVRAAAVTARALVPGLRATVSGKGPLVAAGAPAVLRAVRCVVMTTAPPGARVRLTLVDARGRAGVRIVVAPLPSFAACEASRAACEAAVGASGGRLAVKAGVIRLDWPRAPATPARRSSPSRS